MENPIKLDVWGVAPFQETTKYPMHFLRSAPIRSQVSYPSQEKVQGPPADVEVLLQQSNLYSFLELWFHLF